MARILLGVTGSVAAIKTPELFAALQSAGHDVKIVATKAATYFFEAEAIGSTTGRRNPERVILDEDEWPGQRYRRDDDVLHIELRRWADLLLIAPLDANSLAKLANGLCDNCLTCVWRAWDRSRPVCLAPAMNTLMWQHALTSRHLRQLAEDNGLGSAPTGLDEDELVEWINQRKGKLTIVPPQSKRLACGDVGVGAMAGVDVIVATIREPLAAAEV